MSALAKGSVVDMQTDDVVLTENARKVLEARYLKRNEAGDCIEKPADLFRRVAIAVADVEQQYGSTAAERLEWEERFYRLMTSGQYMPNSPTLMNAGREMGMLSACFVLPVRDSINDIFDSIKHTALIQKAGGGTGFAFDELRPTGDFIASSGGTTSGPITFWKAFSEATNAIQQGAFRRGANMGMMYIHHPDILKFLHSKQDLSQFTNYNISVKVTDAWMEEFIEDADSPHIVRNPRTGRAYVLPKSLEIWKYDIKSLIEVTCVEPVAESGRDKYFTTPRINGPLPAELAGKVYTKRDIWTFIINNAWQTGEPGVVFIDRINEHNPTPHVGRIEATNPCGEQPLLPYEACNLGSVNLGLFVKDACTPQAQVDWAGLQKAVHESVRFLDNVIDANNYPLTEIDNICKANRKIGLGIMGFADALFKLNIAYNSTEGAAWGERFMRFVNDQAHIAGEQLAKDRGCFPNWQGSIWQTRHKRLMRNAATTTVAPTGTISIIANCSGGIEPMFSLAFIRNVLRGQKQGEKPLVEVNETFLKVAKERGFYSEELVERIAREGTLAHIDEIPEDVKRVFVCAHDITPEWHMQMQAAFQRHCDSSISKTINFPHEATVPQVEEIYRLAFELRCKGVTVYRDGCRQFQPMALKKEEEKSSDEATKRRSDEGKGVLQSSALQAGGAAPGGTGFQPVSEGTKGVNKPNGVHGANGSNGAHLAGGSDSAANSAEKADPSSLRRSVAPSLASASPLSAAASALPLSAAVQPANPTAPPIEPLDLPEIVSGLRIRQLTPFGNMHVKITVDPRANRELEVFAQLGKGGDVATSDLEAICRMISLWLRSGGSLRHVIKQLEGIGSSLQIPTKAGRIMSLGDGLACALKKYVKAKERFGLRPLLLGEIDLADLDNPPPPHTPRTMPTDRTVAGAGAKGATGGVGGVAAGTGASGAMGGTGFQPVAAERGHAAASPSRLERRLATDQTGPSGLGGSAGTEAMTDSAGVALMTAEAATGLLPLDTDELLRDAFVVEADGHTAAFTDALHGPDATTPYDTDATTTFAAASTATRADALLALDETVRRLSAAPATALAEPPMALETLDEMLSMETIEETTDPAAGVETVHIHRTIVHTHDAALHYKLKCPSCEGILALQEGCKKCYSCGWAAC